MNEENINNYNISKLNDLLQTANDALACGPSCQNDKQSSLLHDNMLKAQQNIKTAPEEYEKATQAYITFTEGDAAYTTYQETELTKQADEIVQTYSKRIDELIAKLQTGIKVNENLAKNVQNVSELKTKYDSENADNQRYLQLSSADVATNQRKTFYEDQVISQQEYYTTLLTYAYIIAIIIYFISVFFFHPGPVSWIAQFFLFFFFLFYFFCGTFILGKLIQCMNYIFSFLPKNVYSDLNNNNNKGRQTKQFQ